ARKWRISFGNSGCSARTSTIARGTSIPTATRCGHRRTSSKQAPRQTPWACAPQTASPPFGRGVRVYNVIDSRQSYLQDVVVAGLRALGFEQQAEASVHFYFEIVALSPRMSVEVG